jgi:glutaminyl-tRNA synthetase
VSAVDALPAEVRLYGRLFSAAIPSQMDLAADIDPHSMQTLSGCLVERTAASDPHGQPCSLSAKATSLMTTIPAQKG